MSFQEETFAVGSGDFQALISALWEIGAFVRVDESITVIYQPGMSGAIHAAFVKYRQ